MRPSIRLSPLLLPAVLVCVLRSSPAPGQPVGPEFRVNSYTTNIQSRPRVASDSGGNFVVVWESITQDGANYGVFGQRYGSMGEPLGVEFRVNAYTTGKQHHPAVASDSNGGFVVVWESDSQDGSLYGIFCQRYGSTGAPLGTEFGVNTSTTGSQFEPGVASDSGGDFVVVWRSGYSFGIFGQRYKGSGMPLGTEFQVNSYTTRGHSSPSVASDSLGNFVVVWRNYSVGAFSDYSDVLGQRYASGGGPLGAEFRTNTYTITGLCFPSVASDSVGNFVVVWQSFNLDGLLDGVFCQRYGSSGGPLGAAFRVNSYTTNFQVRPSVAIDSGGSFAVVWQSVLEDGSADGVFGQRYGSAGVPLGAEFLVNTHTMNDQNSPSVATDSAGHFVVAWKSNTQDGSYLGIFGQRFCAALSSVTIGVSGTTTVCTTSTGGTATVTDAGGGIRTHQWGYRTTPVTGTIFTLSGQTGPSYLINGASFPAGAISFLVCLTTPECGTFLVSNEVPVTVNSDATPPAVTPPSALTTTQTLCM